MAEEIKKVKYLKYISMVAGLSYRQTKYKKVRLNCIADRCLLLQSYLKGQHEMQSSGSFIK